MRIGSPLAFAAFLGLLLLAYVVGWAALGPASLVAGAAVGLAALGLLDNAIARAVAGQPREAILRSPMNIFLSRKDLREATVREGVHVTHVEVSYNGMSAILDIVRPEPAEARRLLEPYVGSH